MKNLSIIGVIILAIIVLIVASITYTYVESIRRGPDSEITDYLQGFVLEVSQNGTIEYEDESYVLFDVTIKNNENVNETYSMFFYELYPPMEKYEFRFYYENISFEDSSIYRIVRVVIP